MKDFVHLNVHTEYSLQSGACRIGELVGTAKSLGQTALAITDNDALYGAVEFFDECEKLGIKAIIGCELRIPESSGLSSGFKGNLLTLLCRNETGYKNLCHIISEERESRGLLFSDMETIAKHSEGLIALSGESEGEISRLLSENRNTEAEKRALTLSGIFHGEFYFELSDHTTDEKRVSIKLRELSKKTGIPTVPTNNVHYVRREQSTVRAVMSCIRSGVTLAEADPNALPNDEFYLKSRAEMSGFFTEEELDRTLEIAEKCSFRFEFGNTKLPRFVEEGVSDNTEFFRKLVNDGALSRYGEITPEIEDRISYEAGIIEKMGFVDYFLIVWDFVNFAKNSGIPVGPGRGSGAASICAYCMRITDIDPLRYNLLFERFLNPERVSMPDFDIDFCNERRGEVIEYVKRRYGSDHVAQIVAFDTLKARAALRDAGRVLGIPLPKVDSAAKTVSSFNSTLDEELANGELGRLCSSDPEIKRLVEAAKTIEGFPRHTSVHAAGVVITREPAVEYVPLQYENDGFTAQYTMTELERLGLLKMDFLGLRNLTIIRRACDLIREKEPEFNIEKIDENDKAVYKMLSEGGTVGVFQFESAGMTSVLMRLKPSSIEDLTAAIALYRPGPMNSIPKYIENRHKSPDEITYAHPLLKNILGVTYGCIVYQEQVMQICREMAGYSYGRADLVRRAMSKKKHDVMEKERGAFVYGTDENVGAVKNGVPAEVANAIFDELAGFASYAFNKAHAAAYATVAYRTAFLRRHYYAEYMTALISACQSTDKLAEYIADLGENNTPILPPDVNHSFADFTVENGGIRFGLASVKGMGRNFAVSLSEEREKNGEFKSVTDFAVRMYDKDLNRRYLDALIRSGALDGFPQNRNQLLECSSKLMGFAEREFSRCSGGQLDLFGNDGSSEEFSFADTTDFSNTKKLAMEKEALGVYISGHPASMYLDRSEDDGVYAADMAGLRIGETVSVIGMLSSLRRITTKKGEPMAFAEFEDATGSAECVLFPNVLAQSPRLVSGQVYRFRGKISENNGRRSFITDKVAEAEALPVLGRKTLYLNFRSESDGRIAEALMRLAEYKGVTGVRFCFEDTREVCRVNSVSGVRLAYALMRTLSALLGEKNIMLR